MTGLQRLGVIAGSIIVLAIVLLIINPTYSVDQGEQGVVLTWGKVTGTSDAGLHFKIPFVQSVATITTQSHFEDFPNGNTGNKFEAYTQDQQPADIQLSINYHIPPDRVAQVYSTYGVVSDMIFRTIDQQVPAVFKNVFGTYDAQKAVQQRAQLNIDVLAALQKQMANEPIVIESVQIKDIKYRPEYEAAISAKQQATVEVQTKEQELAKQKVDAQITVTQAQAKADSDLAVATNQAKAVQIQGEAQAAAIKAKGDAEAGVIKAKADALANNPLLIELTKAESWDGKLPVTMLPNGALPFIDVKPAAAPAAPAQGAN